MTTVLITGGNRGLGLGFVQAYANRPDHTIIAAIRSPDSMPVVELASGSQLVVTKYDAGILSNAAEMIEDLSRNSGINRIDIVIANAAIMADYNPVSEIPLDQAEASLRVNVLGPLALFQACKPLLPAGAKFIFTSSGTSVIGRTPERADAAYGITKSSVNHLARYAHFENPDLIIFALSPGHVQTEMGARGAAVSGMDQAPFTVVQSIEGQLRIIDEATREKWSGVHVRFNGEQQPW